MPWPVTFPAFSQRKGYAKTEQFQYSEKQNYLFSYISRTYPCLHNLERGRFAITILYILAFCTLKPHDSNHVFKTKGSGPFSLKKSRNPRRGNKKGHSVQNRSGLCFLLAGEDLHFLNTMRFVSENPSAARR